MQEVELVRPARDNGLDMYKGNRLQRWNFTPQPYILVEDWKLHTGPGIKVCISETNRNTLAINEKLLGRLGITAD